MDFVSLNLVCNHTSDQQNWTTVWWESDLFNHEHDYRLNWTTQNPVNFQLIISITKFKKEKDEKLSWKRKDNNFSREIHK